MVSFNNQIYRLTSRQITFLKCLAIISMVLDHIGYGFNVSNEAYLWLRGVGRFSFIVFSGLIVYQVVKDERVIDKYIPRLILFMVIAQLPYMNYIGAAPYELNILGSFLAYTLYVKAFYLIENTKDINFKFISKVAATLLASVLLAFNSDYGMDGLLFMILFASLLGFKSKSATMQWIFAPLTTVSAVVLSLTLAIDNKNILWFSLVAFLFLLFAPKIVPKWKLPRLPTGVYYWFYPVHLYILFIIAKAFNAQ